MNQSEASHNLQQIKKSTCGTDIRPAFGKVNLIFCCLGPTNHKFLANLNSNIDLANKYSFFIDLFFFWYDLFLFGCNKIDKKKFSALGIFQSRIKKMCYYYIANQPTGNNSPDCLYNKKLSCLCFNLLNLNLHKWIFAVAWNNFFMILLERITSIVFSVHFLSSLKKLILDDREKDYTHLDWCLITWKIIKTLTKKNSV